MKLKIICEGSGLHLNQTINRRIPPAALYVGGNFGGSVIVPGFCSVYLVQALWYAGPHVYKFVASPMLVDDSVFGPMALDGSAKNVNVPVGGVIHSASGECVVNDEVRSEIMSPSLILGELRSGGHDLRVRGFYREVSWSGILEFGRSRFGDLFPDFVRFALDNELVDDEDEPDEVFERFLRNGS